MGRHVLSSASRAMSLAFLFSCLASLAAALTATGTTIIVNDIYYFIPPTKSITLTLPSGFKTNQGWVPMTAVVGSVTASTFKTFSADDDVFQPAFEKVLFVQDGSSTASTDITTEAIITSKKVKIPQGPYFLDSATGDVFMAYRLYSDSVGAFTETLLSNGDGTFSVLPANIPGQNLAVAVPSRLYYTPTTAQPLAGVRFGIKDIFDIAGVHTSNGNRAWYHFYPAANTSAVAVQLLIDAGAIIVGKMKTSMFANGETATDDWVDYHEPFNPRGDGYQDTSSSSAGPGAGTGAYPWLDITMGSDTGGSIRGPSEVQGLYGNRPSHGMVSLTGVMPLAPELDTAGFLTCDPELWSTAANVLYGGLPRYPAFPKTVYTLGFPTSAATVGDAILLDFLGNLTSFLGANATAYSIPTAFAANPPPNSPTTSTTTLLNLTYPILIGQEQVLLVRDPFYADYAAAYDGRLPFVDPAPIIRWDFAESFGPEALPQAVTNKTIFMDWFQDNVLIPSPNSTTCSNAFMLYVGSSPQITYRNVYRSAPSAPYGFSNGRISPFTECPDFVLPIGQAPYLSAITNVTEYLPVTVDILVAKGCDGVIFDLAIALEKAGILGISMTGRTLEDGGEILYKRDFPLMAHSGDN